MTTSHTDWEALAQGLADLRELLQSMVAGLVADGFTDREAREIVTALLRQQQDPS